VASATGVVYYADSGTLHALEATTGNELWHDAIEGIYITDGSSYLTAYGV